MREQPLLVVPPMINKYYAIDLAPGRSASGHIQATAKAPGTYVLAS